MFFSYDEYYVQLYTMPLIQLIISVVLIVFAILILYFNFREKPVIFKNLMFVFILACVSIFFFFISISTSRFNISKDFEDNLSTQSGVITEIVDVKNSPRYYYEDKVVNASIITINNEDYYILTIGEYEVGDNVRISFLQNSKAIISIIYI